MTMLMGQERLPISEPLAGLLTEQTRAQTLHRFALRVGVSELNTTLAGQAVKAFVAAILDSLAAGEAVRVSGLGTFNVAARPARDGRNPQSGETIKIPASKAVRFHAGKAVKDVLNPPKGAARKKSTPSKRSALRK